MFPAFKLNCEDEKLEGHGLVANASLAAYGISFALSFSLTLLVIPEGLGALFSMLFTSLFMIRFVTLTTMTGSDLAKVRHFITAQTVKNAWLETKELYCK